MNRSVNGADSVHRRTVIFQSASSSWTNFTFSILFAISIVELFINSTMDNRRLELFDIAAI